MAKTPKKPKKPAAAPKDQGKPVPHVAGSKIHRREVKHRFYKPVDSGLLPELTGNLLALLKKEELVVLQRKDKVAGFRAELKEVRTGIQEARVKIEKGETIEVACIEIKDFDKGTVSYQRIDTKEIVDTRAITEEDKQLALGEHATDTGRPASAATDLEEEDEDDED